MSGGQICCIPGVQVHVSLRMISSRFSDRQTGLVDHGCDGSVTQYSVASA